MEGLNVDQITQSVLSDVNRKLGRQLDGDCVFIKCGLQSPLDDEFRVVIEGLTDGSKKREHLAVMLETNGGYLETVERLVSVMRTHYRKVSFIVPNYAYSAGTVLALSGDNIHMDYYSVLGPIDPQYRDTDGNQWPGSGYLAKYKELVKTINEASSPARAEIAYLVRNFDPAQLFGTEQAIQHGISLVTEWLTRYKFKDWKETEKNGKPVTNPMKKNRAEQIAKVLGDAARWHSHGRGISMKELSSDEIKLKIDDFGKDNELNDLIRHYHGLCVDYYTVKSKLVGYIHSQQGLRRVL